ncbi:MAG: response regulator [Elusimicrobia bacterium]|nr:response regulator [Elusimicrobiota bacterium]
MAKILLIDDDEEVGMALKHLLTGLGFNVFWTQDAIGASIQSQSIKPDVLILDFSLPGANGAVVYRRLRQNDSTRNTPILLISGHPKKEIDGAFRDEGISTPERTLFLTKPLDPATLKQVVLDLMKYNETPGPK